MTQSHQDPAAKPEGSAAPPPSEVDVALVVVQLAELRTTYQVSDLLGRPVINDADEEIGRLDDLMIEHDRVAFAILSVDRFLGIIGGHQVVVAFDNLLIDDDELVLPGATKAALKEMTVYDQAKVQGEHAPRRKARPGVKDSGQIVETALGEQIPGSVADAADGDR